MEYLERSLFKEITKWVNRREIIAIKGPRQSGKTTLLEMLQNWLINDRKISKENVVYVSFEDREQLDKFSSDSKVFVERYLGKERLYFFIDEAHYCKDLGQKLKLLYDTFRNVKFFISGSSSLEITSQTAKFLVGRLFSFELLPFSFYEFLLGKDRRLAELYYSRREKVRAFIFDGRDFKFEKDIILSELMRFLGEYLIYGGYPEVIKAKDKEEKEIVLKNIYNTYVEKDIISYLQITDTLKFRKLVSLLSFITGNLVSYEKLAVDCSSYYKEILKLMDVLEQTYIVKILRPFHKNLVTELRKNPKIYFFDLGLRNYFINNFNNYSIREDAGKLAENYIINALENEGFAFNFWRTTSKAEVDFVVSNIKDIVPIEVKFENIKKEKLGKSLYSFLAAYKPSRGVVVTKSFWGEMNVGKTNIRFIPIVYF